MKYLYSTLFFLFVLIFVYFFISPKFIILLSTLLWIYMAVNIWANDVANSVWPAVGSRSLKLKWAIIIAAIWNILWATLAWWDVVGTVKGEIIDISKLDGNVDMYIQIMLSSLLAAAIWLNVATYFRAPVSTTHAIVWAIMWAWIMALWFDVVSRWTVWEIVVSWIISPLIWWLVAALFFLSIRENITLKKNMVKAAKFWVPIYVSIMSWVFSTYLIVKWLNNTAFKMDFSHASAVWLLIALFGFIIIKWYLREKAKNLENNNNSISSLFGVPLIFWVWLLTFAHWANDVANAIWPLVGIYDAVIKENISSNVSIPFWIMCLWASWIALWLSLFWPRIIKTVWTQITEIDQIRAFCIALATATTVIFASQLGLPVSSTHVAIGWVFWIWLFREWLDRKIKSPKEKYVERKLVKRIVAAWFITLPIAALISWGIFSILTWVV